MTDAFASPANFVYLPLVQAASTEQPIYGPFGMAGADSGAVMDNLPFYDWTIGAVDAPARQARMIWCVSDEWLGLHGAEIAPAALADFNDNIAGRVWLVNNEPEIDGQCGSQHINSLTIKSNPRPSAVAFHAIATTIKASDPNALVFVGGLVQIGQSSARNWWSAFVDELDDNGWLSDIDGVHIHGYARWSASCGDPFAGGWPQSGSWCWNETQSALDGWKHLYHDGLGLDALPIWITESGCAAYAEDLKPYGTAALRYCRDGLMTRYQDWFDGSGYDAIYWYRTEANDAYWPTALVMDGQQTALGTQWMAN